MPRPRLGFPFRSTAVQWGIPMGAMALLIYLVICRTDVHFWASPKPWISPRVTQPVEPLSRTCFPDTSHDVQQAPQTHHFTFMTGHRTDYESTCYDLASTVRYLPHAQTSVLHGTTTFHTFWSRRVSSFADAELATMRSFAATQDMNRTQLFLWVSKEDEAELLASPPWRIAATHERITHQVIDWAALANGTRFQNSEGVFALDHQALVLRLLVLYRYGGVWFDLQTLFIRDLSPLLEAEWMAQGTCFTSRTGNPFEQSHFFHFDPQSRYVCQLLASAVRALNSGKSGKDALGDRLYDSVYRQILHNGIKPWAIVPWCFTEPSQCTASISLQSPFKRSMHFNKRWLHSIFAFHWHDRQHANVQQGSIFQYLKSIQDPFNEIKTG